MALNFALLIKVKKMDKLRRKRTSKVKNKKEADPSNANNAKLSTTHKIYNIDCAWHLLGPFRDSL